MDKRDCACVADDAQVCFRLRYPEPEEAEWDYNEQCQCPCHGEVLEDEQDDGDEE